MVLCCAVFLRVLPLSSMKLLPQSTPWRRQRISKTPTKGDIGTASQPPQQQHQVSLQVHLPDTEFRKSEHTVEGAGSWDVTTARKFLHQQQWQEEQQLAFCYCCFPIEVLHCHYSDELLPRLGVRCRARNFAFKVAKMEATDKSIQPKVSATTARSFGTDASFFRYLDSLLSFGSRPSC